MKITDVDNVIRSHKWKWAGHAVGWLTSRWAHSGQQETKLELEIGKEMERYIHRESWFRLDVKRPETENLG